MIEFSDTSNGKRAIQIIIYSDGSRRLVWFRRERKTIFEMDIDGEGTFLLQTN